MRASIVRVMMLPDQPSPIPNEGDIWQQCIDLAIKKGLNSYIITSMQERRLLGIERYNTVLQPYNGRDCLIDLEQEILDAIAYAMQARAENRLNSDVKNLPEQLMDLYVAISKKK